jgi:hypothetical protein
LGHDWIRTTTAAELLDWHPRRVQRHAADLDGRRIGHRWWFPARTVHEYREALQRKELST